MAAVSDEARQREAHAQEPYRQRGDSRRAQETPAAAACACGSHAAWRARKASRAHNFVGSEVLVGRACRREVASADLVMASLSRMSAMHLPLACLIAFFTS